MMNDFEFMQGCRTSIEKNLLKRKKQKSLEIKNRRELDGQLKILAINHVVFSVRTRTHTHTAEFSL